MALARDLDDGALLDAYSLAVTRVAEDVSPSVVKVEVRAESRQARGRSGGGSGSAVRPKSSFFGEPSEK